MSDLKRTELRKKEMSETTKKRRRWPWVILVALVLLIGGPIAWRCRPLTAVERAILGKWTRHDSADEYTVTFSGNRTFSMDDEVVGTWSASGSSFSLRIPLTIEDTAGRPFLNRVSLFLGNMLLSGTAEIRWDTPDRFSLIVEGPGEVEFQRITADLPDPD